MIVARGAATTTDYMHAKEREEVGSLFDLSVFRAAAFVEDRDKVFDDCVLHRSARLSFSILPSSPELTPTHVLIDIFLLFALRLPCRIARAPEMIKIYGDKSELTSRTEKVPPPFSLYSSIREMEGRGDR